MKTSVIGYPRIGSLRELKFAAEKYFRNEISAEALLETAENIRRENWDIQKKNGIDFIPSNDFSFYDNMLDTAVLFNAVPERYKTLELTELDTYFAMARGYQGKSGDVRALAMKKWFNTNYHYMVPEIEDTAEIKLVGTKPFDEFLEARKNGVKTKLPENVKKHFAYAEEKLSELSEQKAILSSEQPESAPEYTANIKLCAEQRSGTA